MLRKNKANFRKGRMNVKSYVKGYYGKTPLCEALKTKPILGRLGRKLAGVEGCFGKWARADYSVISHAIATRTRAVIAMKMTMEPNKTTDSLTKWKKLIFGIFVVLYTTEIDATSGSSHNIECGVTPIFSGVVKVAIMKADIVDILFSSVLGSSQVSPVNCVDNTQKIEQPGNARVNLPDFVRPAVNGIISRSGCTPDDCHCRGVHNLGDVPGLCPDGIYDSYRADI
jgi:hypothetical protein